MLVTVTDVHLRGIPPNIKTPLLQAASENILVWVVFGSKF